MSIDPPDRGPNDPARGQLARGAIDEQTAALASPLARETGARRSLLCFRVAGERFALPAADVQRVFEVQPVRRVPHRRRPGFRGLVAHEGEILLLGSLERLLDLGPPGEARVPANARMVLAGPPGRGWVFEVDSVDGVVQVAEPQLRPAPATLRRGAGTATRRIVQIDGADTALLECDSLLSGWEAAST